MVVITQTTYQSVVHMELRYFDIEHTHTVMHSTDNCDLHTFTFIYTIGARSADSCVEGGVYIKI